MSDTVNNVLTVAAIVVLLGLAVIVGALLTGYLVVDEPGAAASQVLTGDLQEPDVEVKEMEIEPLGVPEGDLRGADADGVTFSNEFYISNPNHIGGAVDLIKYDVYLSGDRDGPYEYLGTGTVEDMEVPPNGTVTETNEFDAEYDDLLTALSVTAPGAVVDGTVHARIEGEATFDLGVASFTVEFEETEEIEA